MLKHQLATSLQLFSATPQVHISLGGTHYLVPTHPSFTHPSFPEIQNSNGTHKTLLNKEGLMRALPFSDLIFRRHEDFHWGRFLPFWKILAELFVPDNGLLNTLQKLGQVFYEKAASSK
jgi:hypothetical protein